MLNLLYQCGPLFIGLITIILLIILVISYLNGMPIINNPSQNPEQHRTRIGYIKSLGLLALVIGITGQLIGLYSAFNAMTAGEGSISPNILISGLKLSIIPTIYGMMIYLISYLIWIGLSWKLRTDQRYKGNLSLIFQLLSYGETIPCPSFVYHQNKDLLRS